MSKKTDNRKTRKNKSFWLVAGIIAVIILFLIFVIIIAKTQSPDRSSGNIAIIKITGTISSEASSSPLSVSKAVSSDIVKFIEKAEKNKNIVGVIIEINSPGGTVLASKEIGNAIKSLTKPNVALIRDVGASGGYWVASASDHIIADSLSITGSIGVISSSLSFEGFLKERNISYQRLVAGKYKDAGSPFKDLSDEEFELLQGKLDFIHSAFIGEVAVNRNMSVEKVREISTGIFYLGQEAYDLGLIDELGDMKTAENYLKKKLNVSAISYVEYKKPKSFFASLSQAFSNGFFYAGEGFAKGLSEIEAENGYEILV